MPDPGVGTIRLEPTAALVMRWAMPLYRAGIARRFVESLDLAAGRDLYGRCSAVCDWYGEVILNRKHCIGSLIRRQLAAMGEDARIAILAAGRSPLGLELAADGSLPAVSIVEVDIAGMEEKAALYRAIDPVSSRRIRCLTGDITAPGLRELLGHEPAPSIILLEGISYYLPDQNLAEILSAFRSADLSNRFILEYLLPCDAVRPERRSIPREIFRIIRESAGLAAIRVYAPDEVDRIVEASGGVVDVHYRMNCMELLRTGENRYFPGEADGWIACCTGRI